MSTETNLTVCGKPVKKVGPGKLQVSQQDYRDMLEEHGVTKEVRETIAEANTKIAEGALQAIHTHIPDAISEHEKLVAQAVTAVKSGTATSAQKRLADSNGAPTIQLGLGSGDGKMIVSVETKRERDGRNPHTGEPVHTVEFGVANMQIRHSVPKVLTQPDGIVAKLQEDCQRYLEKKIKI